MNRFLQLLVTLLCLAVLTACGGASARKQQTTMDSYATAIRWSEFDLAETFLDPFYLQEHPLSDLERERFKVIQVTGYEVRRTNVAPDGSVEQVVEIRLINRLTQAERSIVDRQLWRWDEAGKRWWLMSGLPNFGKE